MSTIYDWVTIGLFAALIVLFLQRSTDEGPEVDSVWHYLPPSIGCAVANYFGNEGMNAAAIAALAATAVYALLVLKPFAASGGG